MGRNLPPILIFIKAKAFYFKIVFKFKKKDEYFQELT